MTQTPRHNSEQGFLLIEVLFAAALLALVVAVVAGSFSMSYRAMSASEKRTRATLLLQSKLSELRDTGTDLPAEGSFEESEPGYSWRATPAEGSCSDNLCPATISVIWNHQNATHDVSVTAMLPQPRDYSRDYSRRAAQ